MALVLSPFDFLWKHFRRPKCYFSKLPNDVLVDLVFFYLDVEDVLSIRQVSKMYYYLSHHPIIWKRLLRWAEVPLPPLPPTQRHSLANMNGHEAERLCLRAASLERNWKNRTPRCLHRWQFNAHHNVHSMVVLPGGQYAVAAVSDGTAHHNPSLVVFVMDYATGGAVPLAKTPTVTRAYHLQARYMTVKGIRGITIAYVRRDYIRHRDRENAPDISEFTPECEPDAATPVKHECVALHVSLRALEILGDTRWRPGTDDFLRHARAQPPPFRRLALVRTAQRLGAPALDELWAAPYLAVAKGADRVLFKRLDGGAVATLVCRPVEDAAHLPHRILAIRLVPAQQSVLVVRAIEGDHDYPVETYGALACEEVAREDARDCAERTWVNDNGGTVVAVQISDHGIPPCDDASVLPTLFGAHDTPRAPRPISVFFRTVDEDFIIRITFYPRRRAAPAPAGAAEDARARALFGAYTAYEYPLHAHSRMKVHRAPPAAAFRVLAGSYRSVVYAVPKADRSAAPRVWRMYRYFDPASRAPVPELAPAGVWYGPQGVVTTLETPEDVAERKVEALAWDETIGRLCVAFEGDQTVTVLDYAKAPRYDERGERVPLPLSKMLIPNPDEIAAPRPVTPPRWRHPLDMETEMDLS